MSPYNLELGWEKRQKFVLIHRAMLMAFVGMPPEGHEGCHIDDNRDNNTLENLYWGTRKQNTADKIRNGKHYFVCYHQDGDKNPNFKYPDEVLQKIKNEYTGERGNQTYLSKKYGLSRRHIGNILAGKARKTAFEVMSSNG